MNFFTEKLNSRISILESVGDDKALLTHYQSRFETQIIIIFSYLWSRNYDYISASDRIFMHKEICKPSIGTIISLSRILDKDKMLGQGDINRYLDEYTQIRNSKIGHGYIYGDKSQEVCDLLKELSINLNKYVRVLNSNLDFIKVLSQESVNNFKGINYSSEGKEFNVWTNKPSDKDFKINNLYLLTYSGDYLRVSPFLEIDDFGEELYIFSSLEEPLSGTVRYNRLLKTGNKYIDWTEFVDINYSDSDIKFKSANGTIRNVYDRAFKNYIDIGIKSRIVDFLKKGQDSVSATIWGHGGVGKTATIQSICDDLSSEEECVFDHIVFLSAKDRRYNYLKGKIEQIDDNISSLDEMIGLINKVVFSTDNIELDAINAYDRKMLIVVDDFETFVKEERDKIKTFVRELDLNRFKVIFTTRSNEVVGREYKTDELSKDNTLKFLESHMKNEAIKVGELAESMIKGNKTKIFEITGGRPLFIIQLSYLIGERGVSSSISRNIKGSKAATSFLYDRIYDYLSLKAKDLFTLISLLVDKNNLSAGLNTLQYISKLENEESSFNSAIDEIEKLRIIRLDDGRKFFTVYSKEILVFMKSYFEERDSNFRNNAVDRLNQIDKDSSEDIEYSLLTAADTNRYSSKNHQQVEEGYRKILNRDSAPLQIKLVAIRNLASYLNERGFREEGLNVYNSYSRFFNGLKLKGDKDDIYQKFIKSWANFSYGNGSLDEKTKAIEILASYFAGQYRNITSDRDVELLGLLLQYKCIVAIEKKYDNEYNIKYGNIGVKEFKSIEKILSGEFRNIEKSEGRFLYNYTIKAGLEAMSSYAQQNVCVAFYSYLDVLQINKSFDRSSKLCKYVIEHGTLHFQRLFRKKMNELSIKN
ncbi:NB-ARC domain-containing protein [Lewinella sp. JB7]|uniref:NB-ARC domain-containing protein n=1 Tax=Lewinella sp. JB7 TaxID=2962887 RepID=UPI0020C9EE60|nr:NB-ARC domain-containing protein [Lewinella sp. JB7]MCP9237936.1 NB-ARC domain-containing protein [Lewinella sp. JB7]